MFTNISWANYFFLIILLLLIYYITIGVRFYFDDVKNMLSGNRKFRMGMFQTKDINNEIKKNIFDFEAESLGSETSFGETSDSTFSEVDHLTSRLKDAIVHASEKQYIKQEFFLYLQLILKEYSELKKPAFQPIINELIISECAKHGTVTFDESEVMALWNGIA